MNDRPLALFGASPLAAPHEGADSVLLEGGRITCIGREADVAGTAPAGTRRIALAGRKLSPGFHDAHFHFFQTGCKAERTSLASCRSVDDVLEAARDAAETAGTRMLLLEGWDEERWARPETPTRRHLDRAVPDRPVIARRACDHVAVANGPALELLRRKWPGPGIDYDTGICREDPVLLLEDMFPPDEEETDRAMAAASNLCLSLGITSTSDFLRPGACRSYRSVLSARELPLRLNVYVLAECLDEPGLVESLPATDRFRVRGIKVFADGSIGGRTAALFEPYHDRTGERGALTHSPGELQATIRRAHEAGLSAAVHAIGDRAIAGVLDAFATLPAEEVRERRHRIEHLELPRAEDLDRLVAFGVRPCVQPNFLRWGEPGGLYETALGRDRLGRMNPLRTLLNLGTGVFFGSDGMPPGPLFGIRCAVNHPVESERLSVAEAHRLYTEAPAQALDGEGGRLDVGSRADLVVLGGEAPGREHVWLTIVGSEVVWTAEALERPSGS